MSYCKLLTEVNGLHEKGFKHWFFAEGMAFRDTRQWWGGKGKRVVPHEGIDFHLYKTDHGTLEALSSGALVPAILAGDVVCVQNDFLGRTVWLRHGEADLDGFCLYSVYGHMAPSISLVIGEKVSANDIIGVVADSQSASKKVPSHLHLSVVRVVAAIEPLSLNWALLQDSSLVEIIDPLSV